MTATQTSITHRGQKKAKPKSDDLKPGRSIGASVTPAVMLSPAIDLDHNLIPPAGQLRRSSRHPLRARKYVTEHRARLANKRPSSIPGMVVPDPISIVHLKLAKSEMDQVIAVSKVLAVRGRDDKRIMTPQEYLDWMADLAKGLLVDLLTERLKGQK